MPYDHDKTDIDWAALRSRTPGAAHRVHLDNCGSALMSEGVAKAVTDHLALELSVGGYVAQERRAEALEDVYGALADLLGGTAADYAFTSGAVDAWTRAFYSVPWAPGDNLVTAYNEYCSNYVAYLHIRDRFGVEIRTAGRSEGGGVDLEHIERLVDDRTRLITLSHVPSSSGEINDVASVGALARQAGIFFLLDACQSIGQLPVHFEDIGCHIAAGTSRKFLRGPRGAGFLYLAPSVREALTPAMLTNQTAWVSDTTYQLRGDARSFEAWERAVAQQLGLGAAVSELLELGIEPVSDRLRYLSRRLRRGIADSPTLRATCPEGADAAIVTFQHGRLTPQEVKAALEARDIAVNVASVVHTRLDLGPRGVGSAVRAAPHVYNTEAEIDHLLDTLEAL